MTRLRFALTGTFVLAVGIASGVLPIAALVAMWLCGGIASMARRDLVERGAL